MPINDSRTLLSLEFFPPRSGTRLHTLTDNIRDIQRFPVDWVSVTDGAGGSTRQSTEDLVVAIRNTTRFDPVAHLTCVGHRHRQVEEMLTRYARNDIGTILALGGDPPAGTSDVPSDYAHAIDLVHHIVDFNRRELHPREPGFAIGVAGFPEGHPATPNRTQELEYLRDKVAAGADYICTQLFFDNHDFLDYRRRCRQIGITVPIVAGLMPVISRRMYERIPELALGAHYPAEFMQGIAACADDAAIARFGIAWALRQARDLLEHHVAGIHFYCLNDVAVVRTLCAGLKAEE